MSVKHVKDAPKKGFETVYIKDAIAYYARVHKPVKKYKQDGDKSENKSENQYVLTVFVSTKDREELEDKVKVNKSFYEVGKDKNKKKAIKFPIDKFEEVKGLHGVSLTLDEFYKNGNPAILAVVDDKGQLTKENIGNGSKVDIKCTGYRNEDGLLVIRPSIIKITDLVPYEGGGGNHVVDDELGVDIDFSSSADDNDFGEGAAASNDDDVDPEDF